MFSQRLVFAGLLALGLGSTATAAPKALQEGTAAPAVATEAAQVTGEVTEAAAKLVDETLSQADRALLGSPMTVNGEVISVTAIKRHLCLGTLGAPYIQNLKLKAYMDEELGRRKAAGVDVGQFEVTDADIQAAIDEAEENVKKEYPGQDVELKDVLPINPTNFKDQIRQTQLFDKMFLPENPNEYPEITIQALNDGAQGAALYDQLKTGWDQKQDLIAKGEMPEEDAASKGFLTMLLRQLVIKYLDNNAVVEAPETGLADDMALRVNGQPIFVDTIWQLIQSEVSEQAVQDSRNWLVNTTLARQALQKDGVWQSDEEFQAAYSAHSDPYKDSPFSVEMVATQFKKFPSVNDYRMYFRISESFKKKIAADMTDEALVEHGKKRTNQIVGLGKVDVDVILCSAYDFREKAWLDNGWDLAQRKAMELATALRDGAKTFDQCIEEYSDFYDPPLAESQKAQVQPNQLFNKGRFTGLSRNELLQKTFESDYSVFLNGNAIADEIFFNMEVGKVAGPWRGPRGWYVARLNKRFPGSRTLSPADSNQRTLLEQEFLASRLNEYVQGLYDGAKIVETK